jgi:spermidine synthase
VTQNHRNDLYRRDCFQLGEGTNHIHKFFGATLCFALLLAASSARGESRTLFEHESQYNHVIVTQEGSERIMHFRRQRVDYRETVMDTAEPLRLVNEYTRLMMTSLVYVPRPQRVLMIGLGGGIVTRVMAHHLPDTTFDNVELDQVVVDAAQRFFSFSPSNRMRVHVRDGRVFLRRSRERYDIIILDAYRGGFIPFHLKSREFLEMVRDRLAPGGVVVANLHHGTRLYDADRVTYDAVFNQVYPFMGRVDSNVILIATNSDQRLSPEQMQQRAERLQTQHQFSFDLPTQVGFYRERDRYNHRARVLTDDHAPVEALDAQSR